MKARLNMTVGILMVCAMVCAIALSLIVATAPGFAQGKAPQAPVFKAPTDKAAFFYNKDIQNDWKMDEAKDMTNTRIMEGGTFSINVRTYDPPPKGKPLVHAKSIDLWIVEAGTATAVTGGELVNGKKNAQSDDEAGDDIRGGTDTPMKVGDLVYVPTGVPHTFKDMKGFRALLIRWEPK